MGRYRTNRARRLHSFIYLFLSFIISNFGASVHFFPVDSFMHSDLTALDPILHSACVSDPREGLHRFSPRCCRTSRQSDATGTTAWIKELRVEPLTCPLIIQRLAGSAKEIYTDRGGGPRAAAEREEPFPRG